MASNDNFSFALSTLVCTCEAFGAVATFFGYFLLGPVLFTTAFLVGGGACFVAVRAALDSADFSAWVSIVAMLMGGGLFGFAAVKMLSVGMFAVGATLGVATSAALRAVLWSRLFPASPETGFIFGSCILGIVFGVISLTLRKKMLILSTAYSGSFGMFFGIGHFAGHFPTLKKLDQVEAGMFDPWAIFYISMAAIFGTAGMILQLSMTKDKVMPTRSPYSRHMRHNRLRNTSQDSNLSGSHTAWEWDHPVKKPRTLSNQVGNRSEIDTSIKDVEAQVTDWGTVNWISNPSEVENASAPVSPIQKDGKYEKELVGSSFAPSTIADLSGPTL